MLYVYNFLPMLTKDCLTEYKPNLTVVFIGKSSFATVVKFFNMILSSLLDLNIIV